ncbi:unnamed protein product [Spirodela intermedia]|uniref:Uncharacterized protein n=1 Tax=Spirodela intermedia TaxID=51605 RepID=A0A7I8LCY7_SPIIN|nr:unnamed protein product [Spirodela intermedia]
MRCSQKRNSNLFSFSFSFIEIENPHKQLQPREDGYTQILPREREDAEAGGGQRLPLVAALG